LVDHARGCSFGKARGGKPAFRASTKVGHDSYPRAIRTELGERVRDRTNQYFNNRIEQDHRGTNGRCEVPKTRTRRRDFVEESMSSETSSKFVPTVTVTFLPIPAANIS
jgi:hypothetical protein